jgi:hypothetical protein
MLAENRDEALAAYRRLIHEGTAADDIDFQLASAVDPRVLGDAGFIRSLPRNAGLYRTSLTLDQIIDAVCTMLGLERGDVLSKSGKRDLVLARSLIAWHAMQRGVATLSEASRRVGRDPSTVSTGIERNRRLRPKLFTLEAFPTLAPLVRAVASGR